MANIEDHANCCGIKHLQEWDEDDDASDIDWAINNYHGENNRKLLEVVFNRDQVNEHHDVVRYMKEKGFRLVSEFNNSSGSDCFVFHLHNANLRHDRPAILNEIYPLRDNPPVVPARAPRIQERTVFSTFHCVFADGRKGAGYDTVEEARANLGRRRRIMRRDVSNTGVVFWVEIEE